MTTWCWHHRSFRSPRQLNERLSVIPLGSYLQLQLQDRLTRIYKLLVTKLANSRAYGLVPNAANRISLAGRSAIVATRRIQRLLGLLVLGRILGNWISPEIGQTKKDLTEFIPRTAHICSKRKSLGLRVCCILVASGGKVISKLEPSVCSFVRMDLWFRSLRKHPMKNGPRWLLTELRRCLTTVWPMMLPKTWACRCCRHLSTRVSLKQNRWMAIREL
mmetsp:Transcript_8407/g.13681  ORF Transcript_8407/g.13681 Transcript_8407/m.13681 type:complete len:218 (+) Transcript_8407:84-737(+)